MPGRDCDTCRHWRPGPTRFERMYGKCVSPRRESNEITFHSGRKEFYMPEFAETCRGADDLCGPTVRWWEARTPAFELVEDEPRGLDWEDPEEDD